MRNISLYSVKKCQEVHEMHNLLPDRVRAFRMHIRCKLKGMMLFFQSGLVRLAVSVMPIALSSFHTHPCVFSRFWGATWTCLKSKNLLSVSQEG